MISKGFVKRIKVWHLHHNIMLWMIWIEHNDRVFNQEQWDESKIKHIVGMTSSYIPNGLG